MILFFRWFQLIVVVVSTIGFSNNILSQKYLGLEIELLELTDSNVTALTPNELFDDVWVKPNVSVPNLGNSNSWIWARLNLDPGNDAGLYVEIAYSTIDSLQVFMVCDGVTISDKLVGVNNTNNRERLNIGNYPSFLIPTIDCDNLTCYIRAWSGKQLLLPVRIESSEKILSEGHIRDVLFAIYLGIVMSLLLYNLFLFFSVKDKNYLHYVFFIIAIGGTQLVLNGYDRVFNLVSVPWISLRMTHIFGILSGVLTILFSRNFLHLKKNTPFYDKLFGLLYIPYFVATLLLVLGFYNTSYDIINFSALSIIILIPASIKVWRSGDVSAGYFLVGWSVFIIAVVIFALKDFGIIPYNEATIYALPLGSAIELVVLSLALGSRINQLKKDSELAKEKELNTSLLNEKIQREQNVKLELNVEERTSQLTKTNASLSETLQDLRSTQEQLIQSEKLASIGQLTAGIAHELNNPINYVSSSAVSLKRDFIDVKEILSLIVDLDPNSESLSESVESVKNKLLELDITFTVKEIDELLEGVEDGAKRTAEIVRGLRIFSRMDGNQEIKANINELLSSTLIILRSNLKHVVDVDIDLAEDIPDINCQPGKLNQVFMNIITNAAHATIDTDLKRSERSVKVSTRIVKTDDSEVIQVKISDNGVGMSQETQSQIFIPFFTTKDVGKGTGLGLSIVQGILEDHDAQVEISSTMGEGTIFILSFPT
jgi:two-component system NtrC family sensor kinase